MDCVKKPLGNAYTTIAEAKLLEILEPTAPPGTRKKNIERELTHIVKYSKEFSYTTKPHMHSAITSEAQSLLLDASAGAGHAIVGRCSVLLSPPAGLPETA